MIIENMHGTNMIDIYNKRFDECKNVMHV